MAQYEALAVQHLIHRYSARPIADGRKKCYTSVQVMPLSNLLLLADLQSPLCRAVLPTPACLAYKVEEQRGKSWGLVFFLSLLSTTCAGKRHLSVRISGTTLQAELTMRSTGGCVTLMDVDIYGRWTWMRGVSSSRSQVKKQKNDISREEISRDLE